MPTQKKRNQKQHSNMSKQLNKQIITILENHIEQMNNPYNDSKMSNMLYERLSNSLKESKTIHHDYTLKDMSAPNKAPNQFMSEQIIEHIQKTLHYQYDISFTYKNITFFIQIMFSNKINIQEYIKYIKWVICFCLMDVKNNKKDTVYFTFYLTSLKKEFNSSHQTSIKSHNINSGYQASNEICIYRKEEWLKVFIHECFHVFNMDFHESTISFSEIFKDTFFIESNFLVFESFVEFWARIINCAIFTYTLKPVIKKTEFHTIFSVNMNMERIFSLIQCTKLLKKFDLTYENIVDKQKEMLSKRIYKEETNAFCYYVITAILMNCFDKTLQWFDIHNHLFSFQKSESQIITFCHYIKQQAKEPSLIQTLDEVSSSDLYKDVFMKMTLFDIQIS